MIDYIKHPELLTALDSSEIGELLREIMLKAFTNSKGKLTTVLAIWSRDCDQCEGTDVYEYHHKPNPEGLDPSRIVLNRVLERVDHAHYNAEGPVNHYIMSEIAFEEYQQHGRETRDRILEAYEDGNGNSVIV